MANMTTNLDLLLASQSQKEITANALFDALSPGSKWGRRASQSGGLVWAFYGGMLGNGAAVANGSLTLTPSATVYIEADPATGAVSQNTNGFSAGKVPLYQATTSATAVTGYIDYRASVPQCYASSVSVAGAATVTLSAAQASSQILIFTGALTGAVDVVFPARPFQFTISNRTTGAFALTLKVSGQPGVSIEQGKSAQVFCDGSDICRAGPDV